MPYLAPHIFAKRKQLGLSLTKMYWLLGRKSRLSTNNKLLIYKAILKPIWTYGIQLWGTTSNDLQIPTVKEEISRFSSLYTVRLRAHTNELIATLTEPPIHKRLRRYWPNDLLTRF
jgi:hypothetical protein